MERLDKTPVMSSFLPVRKPMFNLLLEWRNVGGRPGACGYARSAAGPGERSAELSHAVLADFFADGVCGSCMGCTWVCPVGRAALSRRVCAFCVCEPRCAERRRAAAGQQPAGFHLRQ